LPEAGRKDKKTLSMAIMRAFLTRAKKPKGERDQRGYTFMPPGEDCGGSELFPKRIRRTKKSIAQLAKEKTGRKKAG